MFEFATPKAFMILLIPFLFWLLMPACQKKIAQSLKVPFFQWLNDSTSQPITQHKSHLFWFYGIWLLMVFALAGPQYVGEPKTLPQEGHNIMLVMDISGSMEIRDRSFGSGKPMTRLDLVKKAARTFVLHRKQDQIGLILFGTKAYLQTPLTRDHRTVDMRLEDASVGLAGKTTSIGDALGLAIKHMQDIPSKGRVIILLTDGANNSGTLLPLKAAEIAKKDNIKVYTIGLSGSQNIPMFGQMPVIDDLDENTLKSIADMTGGQYFHASDMASLQKTYATIDALETTPQKVETARPIKSYYTYPLTLAFGLFILWLMMSTISGFRKTIK